MGKIIALSGEAGVGKDEIADALVSRGYVKTSFASNLKEMCQFAFRLTPYHTDTQKGKKMILKPPLPFNKTVLNKISLWLKKSHNIKVFAPKLKELENKYIRQQVVVHGKPMYFKTPREILQFVGTEICRAVTDTYHTEVLFKKIKETPHANYVVTDARFENERKLLKDYFGATLIRVKRPGYSSATTQGLENHASETSMGADEDYDIVINNGGTIEELRSEAIKLL